MSALSDISTEAGICPTPPTPFSAFFPYFAKHDFLDDEGGGDRMQADPADVKLSLPNCLAIGGKLHIIARLTKGLLAAMPRDDSDIHAGLNELTILECDILVRNQCPQ